MRVRFGLKTMLGIVLAIALFIGFYVTFLQNPPWHRAGGMIGWSQTAIEARLGPPSQVFEYDIPTPPDQFGPPRPAGTYRTAVFTSFNGRFVVRLKAEARGYVCFRSSWVEKGCYY